jgi:hypothetical protein
MWKRALVSVTRTCIYRIIHAHVTPSLPAFSVAHDSMAVARWGMPSLTCVAKAQEQLVTAVNWISRVLTTS